MGDDTLEPSMSSFPGILLDWLDLRRQHVKTVNGGTAVDLFAGAGGLTAGFKAAGASVLAAVEMAPMASATFAENHPEVMLFAEDIRNVNPSELLQLLDLGPGELGVIAACAPCQGFSTLGPNRPDDPRNDLVMKVLDFVAVTRPLAVVFENVPQLAKDARFLKFVTRLRALGYGVHFEFYDAADFGVPQRRRRLVLIAIGGLSDTEVTRLAQELQTAEAESARITVRQVFSAIGPIDNGDPLHVSRAYPGNVLERIRAIPKDGGGRHDLPDELWLQCHRTLGRRATSTYGRMRWDDVAPTLTTRCTSPSCGRFLHPQEDRAITLREAAALQTFPIQDGDQPSYQFVGGRMSIEAQIGNAVPVRFAEVIWRGLAPAIC